jgi:hypothetical protein
MSEEELAHFSVEARQIDQGRFMPAGAAPRKPIAKTRSRRIIESLSQRALPMMSRSKLERERQMKKSKQIYRRSC